VTWRWTPLIKPIAIEAAPSSFRHASGRNPCACEQARSEGCKSPPGRCPDPVAEGNCVTARWGGEQPEANMQSVR